MLWIWMVCFRVIIMIWFWARIVYFINTNGYLRTTDLFFLSLVKEIQSSMDIFLSCKSILLSVERKTSLLFLLSNVLDTLSFVGFCIYLPTTESQQFKAREKAFFLLFFLCSPAISDHLSLFTYKIKLSLKIRNFQ